MNAESAERLLDEKGEVVVQLASGWTLRSGCSTDDFVSGEYVRLCNPEGREVVYWDQAEWATDPILVMGAIINSAAGYMLDRELDLADWHDDDCSHPDCFGDCGRWKGKT